MKTENKKALIIGGGIGGLATAIALKQVGYEVQVFEQTTAVKEVGAGLAMWANAVKVLHKLGLGQELEKLTVPDINGGIRSWRGEMLSKTVTGEELNRRFGSANLVAHRAELQAALLNKLGQDAVCLNARLESFEQDQAGVTARFSNGLETRGNLLIGADGIHSQVRARLFGSQKPRYAGYTAYRAVVAFPHSQVALFGETWGQGTRFGIAPLSEGRVYWFATRNAPEGEHDAPQARKQSLLGTFQGWADPVEALLEATPQEVILRNDIYDRDPISQWSVGRVTLLGDAAHPMTPNLGQGACQALEDALVLADCLRKSSEVPEALKTYQKRRIERTSGIVRQSRQIGQVGQWHNPLACWLRDTLLKNMSDSAQLKRITPIAGYEV